MPRHKYGQEPLTTEIATEAEEESSPSLKPMKQQSKAVQARWAAEQASEEDFRELCLTLPLDKVLGLHKRIREMSEIAGKIINDRINTPEIQKCKTCGLTYEELRKRGKPDWFLNRPHYDPTDRNIILVDHFCSANCISLENNKTQGVRGVSDRGMLASDNPRNHPRLTHAAQTEATKA